MAGEPSRYILWPSDISPSFLNFPLLLTWQGEPGSFIRSFLSLGTHHLVEKGVQKLGSGDWCNYCYWNVAVSSNLGIHVCTQSHTQTRRHTSIVIYQPSHICTPIEYKKFAWRPLIPVEFLRICSSLLPFPYWKFPFPKLTDVALSILMYLPSWWMPVHISDPSSTKRSSSQSMQNHPWPLTSTPHSSLNPWSS